MVKRGATERADSVMLHIRLTADEARALDHRASAASAAGGIVVRRNQVVKAILFGRMPALGRADGVRQ